ncbi:unnamed protein product, partial [Adineta steineri]
LSINQPKFCSNATWNPDAITLANSAILGVFPQGLFVNINNTVYLSATSLNTILVSLEGNTNPQTYISYDLGGPTALFVTVKGTVYVYNSANNGTVEKWVETGSGFNLTSMFVNGTCYSIFVDIQNNIYCSMSDVNTVILFNHSANTITTIAGNGTAESGPYMLRIPRGIFVDVGLNLYIADCGNNRVQLLQQGYTNMTTVVESGSNQTIRMQCPTSVILDADGYLFIADYNNQRIIGSNANGYRCIVGCTNGNGSASNQLYQPWSLSFDSHGNIFVNDAGNSRVQKFLFISNSCDEAIVYNDTTTSTTNLNITTTTSSLYTRSYQNSM